LYGADGSLHAQLETDGPGVQASYMISSNVADATSVGLPSPFSSYQRLNWAAERAEQQLLL